MSVHPMETGPLAFLDGEAFSAAGAFAVVFGTGDRELVPDAAGRPPSGAARLFQRLRLSALEAMTAGGYPVPDGIVLAACGGLADLQAADVALSVIEAEQDRAAGSLPIIAEFGQSTAAFLTGERLAGGSARLSALVLDEDALAAAIGLGRQAIRSASAPLLHARARMVLQAADAGVPCFWSLPAGETDRDALARLREVAIGNGFTDVATRGEAQWRALATLRAGV